MSGDRSVNDALDAITEGTRVDWDEAIASAPDPETRGTLEAMRVLSHVQELGAARASGVPARWGGLEILETLGSGSFGTVFRARDPALELDVALKVLHADAPGSAPRILEEGRWLARLRHPNVVRVHGVEERDGRIGLRMELVRGRSLDRIVREDGPLGPHETMRIGIDICRALAAVHAAGLVHRDVKAQNVVREDTGRIVLMDFGAGGERTSDADDERHLVGTPLYLAPELLEDGAASPATDVYAVGVLLFHLASGVFPVEATDLEGVRDAHRTGAVRRLEDVRPGLPRSLYNVVDRALDALPGARHVAAEEMARALAAALATGTHERARRSAVPGNLPVQLTRFVGRRAVIEAVSEHVREHDMLTLTGAGGSGKTRLALQLAHELSGSYADGVWFVPLAPIGSPGDVATALANALGIRDATGSEPIEAIVRVIDRKAMLLVLDNCEHVSAGTVPLVTTLLGSSSVSILATSREPLGITGEHVYEVPPLAESEAVQLFVERAQAVRSDFTLDADTESDVTEICRRLDGLPLALELAAARVRTLPLGEISRRLDDRFGLLRGSGVAEPHHHRTLEASIAWSYDLLSGDEQRTLGGLSVFAGGWTLSAAESALPTGSRVPHEHVVDLLSSLVSKSLVRLETVGSDARYDMLETVRAFALEHMGADDRRRAESAFIDWCIEVSAETHQGIIGSDVAHAMHRFESEHENLVTGCRLALAHERVEDGLRIASYMGRYWLVSTRWTEGRRLCEALLAHPGAQARTLMRAAGLSWRGVFAQTHAQPEIAQACFEECLSIRRELGDARGVAAALNHLGVVHYDAGEYDAARAAFEESLTRRREIDEKRGIAQALTNVALCDRAQERLQEATERFQQALAVHDEIGNAWGIAKINAELGFLRGLAGDYDAACTQLRDAIEQQDRLGPSTAFKCYLGYVHLRHGAVEAARAAFTSALADRARTRESVSASDAFRGLALVSLIEGDHAAAARLLGGARATRRVVLAPRAHAEAADAEARLRRELGDEAFEAEVRAGKRSAVTGRDPF